jgi:hypothetical protein
MTRDHCNKNQARYNSYWIKVTGMTFSVLQDRATMTLISGACCNRQFSSLAI